MSSFTLADFNTLSRLMDRNAIAAQKITQTAAAHAAADAVIGGLGGIIPGMGPIALVAALSLQVPVYQALVMDLGRVYAAPPDRMTSYFVAENAIIGAGGILATEFGVEFFKEIAPGILVECGLGAFLSAIPIIGIFAGATLDAAIAATMTWRVGTMASIYYQNGNSWPSSRKSAYQIAKEMTGDLSTTCEGRVDLDSIARKVPEVG